MSFVVFVVVSSPCDLSFHPFSVNSVLNFRKQHGRFGWPQMSVSVCAYVVLDTALIVWSALGLAGIGRDSSEVLDR